MRVYYRHATRSRQCWTGAATVVSSSILSMRVVTLSRPANLISTPTRGLHTVRMVLIYTKSACYAAYASNYLEGSGKVTGARLVDGH